MKVLICVLACFIASAYATVGTICQDESDCDAGECCQILSEFQIASKRQTEEGTCQLYKTENQWCDQFEKINGYCGCGPGLECHSYTVPIETGAKKRGAPFVPPGYQYISRCEPPTP